MIMVTFNMHMNQPTVGFLITCGPTLTDFTAGVMSHFHCFMQDVNARPCANDNYIFND